MSSAVRLKASILICVSFYTARPTLANSFTAPQGGQVIIADEEFDITWVADSTESVKIQLLYGDNIMVGNITGWKLCCFILFSQPGAPTWVIIVKLTRPCARLYAKRW
jgi:hypothetical protein